MRSSSLLLAVTVVASLSAPFAFAADKLNVKTGLWEITSTTHISGMPPLPKEVMDQVTPEQRAQVEQAFKAEAARGPQTDVDRECITEKDLTRPFEGADDSNCSHTITNTTRTTQEVRLTCTGEYKGAGLLRITTPTPETMTGSLDLKMGDTNEAMTIKSQLKGRWLGSDCGEEDATDMQDEPQAGDEIESEEEEE